MRFTPGIPFTPSGIAAIIDANAFRQVCERCGYGPVLDEELDAFARESFAALEREKAPPNDISPQAGDRP